MVDPLNLAGVIGTWVAVFLALVALLGVLPVWLLIRTSRQARNVALRDVDDPTRKYVSRGLSRVNWRVKVPELQTAPRFSQNTSGAAPLLNPSLRNPARLELDQRSSTSWINLLYMIEGSFANLPHAHSQDKSVAFRDGRALLIVNGAWFLCLGVMHRYAFRPDFGLPEGEAPEIELEILDPTKTLAGMSGVLYARDMGEDSFYRRANQEEGEPPVVLWRMHNVSCVQTAMERIGTGNDIPLSTLVYLFLGLLPDRSGSFLHVMRQPPSRRSQTDGRDRRLLKLVNAPDRSSTSRVLLRGLGLPAPHILLWKAEWPTDAVAARLSEDDEGAGDDGLIFVGGVKLEKDNRTRTDCWVSSHDMFRILGAYLDCPVSPDGLLYGAGDDIVLRYAARTTDFGKTLALAMKWIPKAQLGNLETKLKPALDAVTEADASQKEWSRGAMSRLAKLDAAIGEVCDTNHMVWRAVGMLYMFHSRFQAAIETFADADVEATYAGVLLDLTQNRIRWPKAAEPTEYADFHFSADAFSSSLGPSTNQPDMTIEPRTLPYPLAVLSLLQAHLRTLIFSLSLPPKGLQSFLSALSGSTVYVAPTTKIPSRRGYDRSRSSSRGSSYSESRGSFDVHIPRAGYESYELDDDGGDYDDGMEESYLPSGIILPAPPHRPPPAGRRRGPGRRDTADSVEARGEAEDGDELWLDVDANDVLNRGMAPGELDRLVAEAEHMQRQQRERRPRRGTDIELGLRAAEVSRQPRRRGTDMSGRERGRNGDGGRVR